jgi:WD40 repeat protein
VGADGSLRMFDLRALDHSSILFETTTDSELVEQSRPLMRLKWNQFDPYYIATFAQDATSVHIIDIRNPGKAMDKLRVPSQAFVSDVEWCPYSAKKLCISGNFLAVLSILFYKYVNRIASRRRGH